MFDIAIVKGTIVDGTGKEPYQASIYVKDGMIESIDKNNHTLPATETINASGFCVSPGFIDVHTHEDIALIINPSIPSKVSQGITTVVTGLCGYSPAPIQDATRLPKEYSIVIPDAYHSYKTYGDYLHAVAQAQPAVNYIPLVGHSTLRLQVMDDVNRPATLAEIDAMKPLIDEAFAAGVSGFSSGLAYAMAAQSDTRELIELCKHVKQYNGAYITHIRDEGNGLLSSVDEAIEIGKQSGLPVIFSHHKAVGVANHGLSKISLARIDDARATMDIAMDLYPYTFSSTALTPKHVQRGTPDDVVITRSEPLPQMIGKRLSDVMAALDMSANQAINALHPAGALYFIMAEQDVQRILRHDACVIGSDGLPFDPLPHQRLWGTFPRILQKYVREQNIITLPTAVRKMTGLSADIFGLSKRGYIKQGYHADITIFHADTITETATLGNPKTPAHGIEHVFVNGRHATIGTGQLLKTEHRIFPH